MRSRIERCVACAAGAILLGCESTTGDCSTEGIAAVRASITDSLTGAPLAYRSSLIIREGTYVDSVPYRLTAAESASVGFIDAGNDRPGTYAVTVRREGSRVWTRAGVSAFKEDGCRLNQAVLTVRLQPAG